MTDKEKIAHLEDKIKNLHEGYRKQMEDFMQVCNCGFYA
jgi:hypothetical protein